MYAAELSDKIGGAHSVHRKVRYASARSRIESRPSSPVRRRDRPPHTGAAPMTPDDFFALAKKHEAEMVDPKFVDMLGSWQHCSFPLEHLDNDTFEEGLGFDGSSIRGWKGIHESDMMAVPDATTARLDPFFAKPTVSLVANVVDPIS